MTLERSVLIHGTIMTHHEIERITHICGETTVIDVLSWVNVEKTGTPVRFVFNIDYNSDMNEADAYAYISDLPEYKEYIDPNKEALDELLPILTDEQAEIVTNMYPDWTIDISYTIGERVKYEDKLYRCVQSHTSQEGWEPATTSALWTRTAKENEILDWIQPTGTQDAYNKNDKVKHNGSTWISNVDANVWEPGVYGWDEFTE